MKINPLAYALFGGLLLSSFQAAVPASGQAGRVVRVVDADTYDVLLGGQVQRVRLLHVDAPELTQPFGRQAADSVRRLLPTGQLVTLTVQGKDRYGRTLATVRGPLGPAGPGGRLDSVLVVRGWAWAMGPTHAATPQWAAQQRAAQWAGRGLWKCGTQEPVPPYLWRAFDAKMKQRYRGGCTW